MSTVTEKKIAKNILSIMSKAIVKAMDTIDAHEGRYMKQELNLREALSEPFHKPVRRYVHTKAYWAKRRFMKSKNPNKYSEALIGKVRQTKKTHKVHKHA